MYFTFKSSFHYWKVKGTKKIIFLSAKVVPLANGVKLLQMYPITLRYWYSFLIFQWKWQNRTIFIWQCLCLVCYGKWEWLQDLQKSWLNWPIERLTFKDCPVITLRVHLSVLSDSENGHSSLTVGNISIIFSILIDNRQDLASGLVKCEFYLTETKPRQRMWNYDNGHNPLTVWNSLIIFHVLIDTNKI